MYGNIFFNSHSSTKALSHLKVGDSPVLIFIHLDSLHHHRKESFNIIGSGLSGRCHAPQNAEVLIEAVNGIGDLYVDRCGTNFAKGMV